MSSIRPVLAVVPLHLRTPDDLDVVVRSLVSLRCSAGEAALLVVDDASPAAGAVDELEVALGELGGELVRLDEHHGTPGALNVGLAGARDYGFDALLVDPGVELRTAGWLERMVARTDGMGRPAAVVGARLLDARGLIWHAGLYLSMLRLEWFSRLQFGPGDLPEALQTVRCPVGLELTLVRHETIIQTGLLDERLGRLAAIDYCLRVHDAGLESIYEPSACGVQLSPGRDLRDPEASSAAPSPDALLRAKWPIPGLSTWIPDPL